VRRSAILALVLAILAVACSSRDPVTQRPSPAVPAAPSVTSSRTRTPPASPNGFDPAHVLTTQLAWDAIAPERYLPMYRAPGRSNASFAFDTRNPIGRRSPFLVDSAKRIEGDTWLELLLPIRPNGRSAWVREEEVRLVPRVDRIDVDLSRRMLWYYRDGKMIDRFKVGVGTAATPTPRGTFYLYMRVPQPNPYGPYGILAYGLSGFSPVISDWPGGGRAAIHGTPFESNKGQAVSHGCVRVWNPDLKHLRSLPLGTPVVITG
jgi:L,D-transpeptidase catalytic domain